MPAIERAFTDLPPASLYLDTNILFDYLIGTRPRHQAVAAFFLHLAAHGRTTLHVSTLSWVEYAYTVMRQDFRDALAAPWPQQYRLAQWQNPAVRQAYLQAWVDLLDAVLGQFAWTELALTPPIRRQALAYITRFNLKAQDATHLACALAAGVQDFASFDDAFRRVDGLVLWNNRAPAPARP